MHVAFDGPWMPHAKATMFSTRFACIRLDLDFVSAARPCGAPAQPKYKKKTRKKWGTILLIDSLAKRTHTHTHTRATIKAKSRKV